MRIVGGEFKSCAIKPVPGNETRPTTDRVREALFSALYSALGDFEGLRVLDAFAGSGALGLEALSRGAASCIFCDSGRKAVDTIRANIASLKLSRDRARFVSGDTLKFAFAGTATTDAAPFDLVFMDPPYAYAASDLCAFMLALAERGLLAPDALLVYEHAQGDFDFDASALAAPDVPFSLYAQKKYGGTQLSLIRFEP